MEMGMSERDWSHVLEDFGVWLDIADWFIADGVWRLTYGLDVIGFPGGRSRHFGSLEVLGNVLLSGDIAFIFLVFDGPVEFGGIDEAEVVLDHSDLGGTHLSCEVGRSHGDEHRDDADYDHDFDEGETSTSVERYVHKLCKLVEWIPGAGSGGPCG